MTGLGASCHGFAGVPNVAASEGILRLRSEKDRCSAQDAPFHLELEPNLRQQPIPQRRLLELAFNFPETLARELGVRFLICVDEFQDLSLLSNFPQVGDALDIFRSLLQTQSDVTYVAAGSAISLMEGIFHQARSRSLFTSAASVWGRSTAPKVRNWRARR